MHSNPLEIHKMNMVILDHQVAEEKIRKSLASFCLQMNRKTQKMILQFMQILKLASVDHFIFI